MDAATAISAINGIMSACDPKTREKVVRVISVKTEPKKKRPVSMLQAKEDLIRNHFKK